MAGINPISFDMPEYQRVEANRSVSHLAAATTGKADDDLKKSGIESNPPLDEESIELSSTAQQLTKEEDSATEADKKAHQEELKDKQQENRRMQNVSGHAAMATFTKKEAKAHKEPKESESSKGDAGEGDTLTATETEQNELFQAATSGTLEDESRKKVKGGRIGEESSSKRWVPGRLDGGEFNQDTPPDQQVVRPEMIKKVLNRDPQEILADVPPNFKATAEMMVKGQFDVTGKPVERLSQLKQEPRIESSRMELMPAKEIDIMDITEENPPIPDLSQMDAAM